MTRQLLVPAYLLLCILFGGASIAGILPNMILQLLAVPIIVWSFLDRRQTPQSKPTRALLILLGVLLLLLLLQIMPLPPAIWSALPGRSQIAG